MTFECFEHFGSVLKCYVWYVLVSLFDSHSNLSSLQLTTFLWRARLQLDCFPANISSAAIKRFSINVSLMFILVYVGARGVSKSRTRQISAARVTQKTALRYDRSITSQRKVCASVNWINAHSDAGKFHKSMDMCACVCANKNNGLRGMFY